MIGSRRSALLLGGSCWARGARRPARGDIGKAQSCPKSAHQAQPGRSAGTAGSWGGIHSWLVALLG